MTSRIVYTPSEGSRAAGSPRRILYRVAIAGAFPLLAIGIVYLLRLPSLQVREITFTGLETLEEAALHARITAILGGAHAFFLPRSSYFLVERDAIARNLHKEFPRIAAVSVATQFPDTMYISIVERKFWGIFCNSTQSSSSAGCAYIDASGFAYDKAPEPQGALILTVHGDGREATVGDFAVEESIMERLRFFSDEIPKAAGTRIIAYEIRSRVPTEIRARTADGFTLILKRDDDFMNVFRVLGKVLDEEIGEKRSRLDYIDLRFGNKMFYKLK